MEEQRNLKRRRKEEVGERKIEELQEKKGRGRNR